MRLSSNRCSTGAKKAPATRRSKGHGFTYKCAALVDEQRARIYILRRCATMLLHQYGLLSWGKGVVTHPFSQATQNFLHVSATIPLFFTWLENNPYRVSGGARATGDRLILTAVLFPFSPTNWLIEYIWRSMELIRRSIKMEGHVSQSFYNDRQRLFVCLLMQSLITVTCTAVPFYLLSPS